MPAASKRLQYFVYKKTKDTVLGMRIFMNEFSASSLNRQRSEDNGDLQLVVLTGRLCTAVRLAELLRQV